jgi:hypothetical protein
MFYHVLCPNQLLAKRVTNVVCGCLLLIGVLFAAYSAITKYFSTSPAITAKNVDVDYTAHEKLYEHYSGIGKSAIEFAIDSLKGNPDTTPLKFTAGWLDASETHQPVNTQIAFLANLYLVVHVEAFEEAIKRHQNNDPWKQEEVLQAADALMKVAYTISSLTLEDLKPFTERLKDGENKRTYAESLTRQDSYQYRTFYDCTRAYHWIRGGIVWYGEKFGYLKPISEAHAQLFYEEGTIQHSWNQLYNDYCDRVRSYVKEEDLKMADQRHVHWTIKDTGAETFDSIPGTRPT